MHTKYLLNLQDIRKQKVNNACTFLKLLFLIRGMFSMNKKFKNIFQLHQMLNPDNSKENMKHLTFSLKIKIQHP